MRPRDPLPGDGVGRLAAAAPVCGGAELLAEMCSFSFTAGGEPGAAAFVLSRFCPQVR